MTYTAKILLLGSGELGRPVVTSPGVPPDRAKILRDAFMKAMADPALLAAAAKNRLEITQVSGEELAMYRRFLASRSGQQDFLAFQRQLQTEAKIERF